MKTWTLLYGIPWLALSVTILCAISIGDGTESFGAWALLASIVLIGLPHGACDFWLLKEKIGRVHSSTDFAKVLGLYVLLAATVALIWFLLPEFSLIVFLILTAWHFGSGDDIWIQRAGAVSVIPSISRGLVIVAAPLAFHRDDSSVVLNALVRSASDSPSVEMILDYSIYALASGILLLAMHSVSDGLKNKKISATRIIEPIVLTIFFYLVSPLLAVAIYFVAVHSWRHVFRLERYDRPDSELAEKGIIASFVGFYRKALPITAVSLLGLIAIFYFFRADLSVLSKWTSSYLILLSALTVPHALLIREMEKGLAEPLR